MIDPFNAVNLAQRNDSVNSFKESGRSKGEDNTFRSSFERTLKGKTKVSNDESKETSSEDIKKLEKLMSKELSQLEDEELSEMIELLGQFIGELQEVLMIFKEGEIEEVEGERSLVEALVDLVDLDQLEFDGEQLKELSYALEILEEKLSLEDVDLKELKSLYNEEDGELSKVKELLAQVKGEVEALHNKDSKEQRDLYRRAMNQDNIARLSRESQNRKENNIKENNIKLDNSSDREPKQKQKVVQLDTNLEEGHLVDDKSNLDTIKVEGLESDLEGDLTDQFSSQNSQEISTLSKGSDAVESFESVDFKDVMEQITNNEDILGVKSGKEITLQLKPEALGKLEIKIVIEDGNITTRILAESGQIKDLLQSNLANLKESLARTGLQIDEIEVDLASQDGSFDKGFDQGSGGDFFREGKGNRKSKDFVSRLDRLKSELQEEIDGGEIKTSDEVDYVV